MDCSTVKEYTPVLMDHSRKEYGKMESVNIGLLLKKSKNLQSLQDKTKNAQSLITLTHQMLRNAIVSFLNHKSKMKSRKNNRWIIIISIIFLLVIKHLHNKLSIWFKISKMRRKPVRFALS